MHLGDRIDHVYEGLSMLLSKGLELYVANRFDEMLSTLVESLTLYGAHSFEL